MPERLERLRGMLAELEDELRTVEALDERTRKLLEEAAGEIQTALDKQDPEHLEPHSMIEQLKESLEGFEVSHPALSRFVSRLIDGLAQMGI